MWSKAIQNFLSLKSSQLKPENWIRAWIGLQIVSFEGSFCFLYGLKLIFCACIAWLSQMNFSSVWKNSLPDILFMKDYKNDLCIFPYQSLKCDWTIAAICVKIDCIKQKGNTFQYVFLPVPQNQTKACKKSLCSVTSSSVFFPPVLEKLLPWIACWFRQYLTCVL